MYVHVNAYIISQARQASTKALKEAESTLPVKQDKPVFSKSPKTDSSTKETEPIRRVSLYTCTCTCTSVLLISS